MKKEGIWEQKHEVTSLCLYYMSQNNWASHARCKRSDIQKGTWKTQLLFWFVKYWLTMETMEWEQMLVAKLKKKLWPVLSDVQKNAGAEVQIESKLCQEEWYNDLSMLKLINYSSRYHPFCSYVLRELGISTVICTVHFLLSKRIQSKWNGIMYIACVSCNHWTAGL